MENNFDWAQSAESETLDVSKTIGPQEIEEEEQSLWNKSKTYPQYLTV